MPERVAYIREDADPNQCWMTIPAFNVLYPEIAASTDLAATLRTQEREELPPKKWEGTPVGTILRATGIVLGPPMLLILYFGARWRARRVSKSRTTAS